MPLMPSQKSGCLGGKFDARQAEYHAFAASRLPL